jgi:protein TonB
MMTNAFTRTLARRMAYAACALVLSLPSVAALADPHVVQRVEPEFPHEAVRAGIDHGTVKARMTLAGSGEVTRVEILDATPRRLFDRAVVSALSQWKYDAGADKRVVEIDVNFQR